MNRHFTIQRGIKNPSPQLPYGFGFFNVGFSPEAGAGTSACFPFAGVGVAVSAGDGVGIPPSVYGSLFTAPTPPCARRYCHSSAAPCCTHSAPALSALKCQKSLPGTGGSKPPSTSPTVPALLPAPRETRSPTPDNSSGKKTLRPSENSPATGSAECSALAGTAALHHNISRPRPIPRLVQSPPAPANSACSSKSNCSDQSESRPLSAVQTSPR